MECVSQYVTSFVCGWSSLFTISKLWLRLCILFAVSFNCSKLIGDGFCLSINFTVGFNDFVFVDIFVGCGISYGVDCFFNDCGVSYDCILSLNDVVCCWNWGALGNGG